MSLANRTEADLRDPPFEEIVRALSRESAFPVPVDTVQVRQSHISAVFLADDVVYKVKKPVKLPFLDFSTLERRRFFCHEEVRINRPWATDVYLGVVAVTREPHGLRFEGSGPVVDWAVKMQRLPESANLRSRLVHGLLTTPDLVRAAQRIAAIHQEACCCVGDQAQQAEADFRRRLNENWEFARTLPPHLIEPQIRERLETLSAAWLQRYDAMLRERAAAGMIRELHGDLRLEHVFRFPERTPPNDILIIDGIEFDAALRQIDVLADIAFLVMELSFAGRRDLAKSFVDVYCSQTNWAFGRELIPLFAAYRAAVRGKVEAILGGEAEIPHHERDEAVIHSQAHWLWALSELEEPSRRAALVLVSGLPGTGKSSLAHGLSESAHFNDVLRTDVVRKELVVSSHLTASGTELYSAESTERTYDECWCRARKRLLSGGRVIVDATFQRESMRKRFLQLAVDCGARAVWLECTAPAEIVQQRLACRRGDPSDADWSVYQLIRDLWEAASEFTQRHRVEIPASEAANALQAAQSALRSEGLFAEG